MLPEIFRFGPMYLRTINLVAVLALIVMSFIYYRKVREEHFSELEAFDAYLLSLLVGMVTGRLAFVAVHFSDFGWQIWRWIDVVSHPGLIGSVGLIAAGLYLFRAARHFTTDAFQLIDLWSIAVSVGIGLIWLGLFFDGSAYGNATSWPIGVVFPGLIDPHLPIQLGISLFFFILAWYLNWVEFRYRTYTWYRSGKTSAQSGFLIAMAMIATSICFLVLSWLRPPQLVFFSVPLDGALASLGMIFGISILFRRSGRVLFSRRKKT